MKECTEYPLRILSREATAMFDSVGRQKGSAVKHKPAIMRIRVASFVPCSSRLCLSCVSDPATYV